MQATAGFTVQTPVFTAVGVRLRTCSALIVRWPPPLLPFLPPVSPVHFTICSWKNVDVELPNVNACSWARMRGEKIGFFSVISRSGTVELHFSVSFFTDRCHGQDLVCLITLTYFKSHLITSGSDFFLTLRCQNGSNLINFEDFFFIRLNLK